MKLTMLSRILLFGAVPAAAVTALAPSCADRVPVAAKPCPCSDGHVCCSSGVCAADEAGCAAATSSLNAGAVGQWTGYVENYQFVPSGGDQLRLSFWTNAQGNLEGRVILGPGAAPPLPDGEAGWPPGEMAADYVEGFSYPAHDIRWEARRLRFRIAPTEAWTDWCALQTPYPWGDPVGSTYRCLPVGATHQSPPCAISSGAFTLPVDCAKLSLCFGQVCSCTLAGCVPQTSFSQISFDIALAGDEAEGSLVKDRAANVRLVRASNDPGGTGGAGGNGGGGGAGGGGGGAGGGGTGGAPGGGGSAGFNGSAVGGGIVLPENPPCEDASTCPSASTQHCEHIAGACAGTGLCLDRPASCDGAPAAVVCGCDGIAYASDCLRRAAGVSKRKNGACPTGP